MNLIVNVVIKLDLKISNAQPNQIRFSTFTQAVSSDPWNIVRFTDWVLRECIVVPPLTQRTSNNVKGERGQPSAEAAAQHSAPQNIFLQLKAAYITLLTQAYLNVNDDVTSRSVRENSRFFPQRGPLSLSSFPSCVMDEVLRGIHLHIRDPEQPDFEDMLFDKILPALSIYLNHHAAHISEDSLDELRPILEAMPEVIRNLESVTTMYQEHLDKLEIANAVHTALTGFLDYSPEDKTDHLNPLFSATQQEPQKTSFEQKLWQDGKEIAGLWQDDADLKERECFSRVWHDFVEQFGGHLGLLNGDCDIFMGPCIQDIASMLTNNVITPSNQDPLVTREILYSMFEVLLCKNRAFSADAHLSVTLITIAKAFLYLYDPYRKDKDSCNESWNRFIRNGPIFAEGRIYIKHWAQWILVELGVLDVLIGLAESSFPVVKQANLELGYALLEGENEMVQDAFVKSCMKEQSEKQDQGPVTLIRNTVLKLAAAKGDGGDLGGSPDRPRACAYALSTSWYHRKHRGSGISEMRRGMCHNCVLVEPSGRIPCWVSAIHR